MGDNKFIKVAECYANGIGVDKDIQIAKEWYKKAANQGHEEATEKLKDSF